MAYQEKYYYTFVGLDGKNYECEIWENTGATIVAQEIRASVPPFTVNYPGVELFTPVRGSGCKMNLLSQYDRQFIGLYTADMLKYKIILKKNSGTTWQGYLDSEVYSEPFQYIDNYTVSFTGTDGLALLDRMYYLDENGFKYTGTTSTQWEVISNILLRLDLLWSAVFVKIDTTCSMITLESDETIFHKTYIRNDNFYDEDGKPMTCRKVLESILKPYGAFLTITDNTVYISDHITMLPAEVELVTFKQYSSTDFSYVQDADLQMNLGDVSIIGFSSSEQTLEMEAGINEQLVSYSPYRTNELINFEAGKDLSGSTLAIITRGETNYQWEETYLSESKLWEKYNNGSFCTLQGIDGENMEVNDAYLRIEKYTGWCTIGDPNQLSFIYKKQLPLIVHNNEFGIKISMKGYTRISSNLNGEDRTELVKHTRLICRLETGEQKFHWLSGTPKVTLWYPSTGTTQELALDFIDRTKDGYNAIEDKWIDLKLPIFYAFGEGSDDDVLTTGDFIIPMLDTIRASYFKFTIFGFAPYDFDGDLQANLVDEVQDFRIKDIKIEIVDKFGNEVKTKDIEYNGYLNPLYKNSGDKITLTCGANLTGHPIEKAAMMSYGPISEFSLETGSTLYNIQEWVKYGAVNNIEKLLLRSIVSNYETPSIVIKCMINRIDKIVGRLTYDNYFDGKYFTILECEHDLAEATSQITLRETKYDTLIINTV